MHSSPGSYPPGQGGGYPPPPPPYASTPAPPPPPPYHPGGPGGGGGGGGGGYGPPPRRRAKPAYSGLRGTVAGISLVLAVLLTIPALSALWLRWEVVSAEGFTDNAVELIDEPAIRSEVARLMTEELIKEIPSNVRGQASPALIAAAVQTAIARPDFKAVWRDGVSTAHDVVMSRLLGRESENVTVEGDKVVVTLKTPLDSIVRELNKAGIPASAAGLPTTVPIDLAELPNTAEEQQSRDALRAVDDAGQWLPILALVLLVLGLVVAVNRFRALAMTGVGLFLASGLMLLMVPALKDPVADELATTETLNRSGVEAVYEIFTDSLTTMSWSVFAASIVAVVVGALGLALNARRR